LEHLHSAPIPGPRLAAVARLRLRARTLPDPSPGVTGTQRIRVPHASRLME